MADKGKHKDKGDASDEPPKDKKDKKKKGKGAGPSGGASVANHPRAAAAVRRTKGVGGLVSFVLAAWLSHQAGLSPTQVAERALAIGVAGYLLAWTCAVTVWRQIVLAEVRATIEMRRGGAPGPSAAPRTTAAAPAGDETPVPAAGDTEPTPAAAAT